MMEKQLALNRIAVIRNPYTEKFGVPRQSGRVEEIISRIIFEPPYRTPDAFRGLEEYSHIWLIWEFSQARREKWSATVRPPRLGGNTRLGVFATRSPFRPNPLGLSCVRLLDIQYSAEEGPVLTVSGADLMSGTPILDIKPYLSYTDAHPDALGGFTDRLEEDSLCVDLPEDLVRESPLPEELAGPLRKVLSEDPRPRYQEDPNRLYGLSFGGCNIRFRVRDHTLTVTAIE